GGGEDVYLFQLLRAVYSHSDASEVHSECFTDASLWALILVLLRVRAALVGVFAEAVADAADRLDQFRVAEFAPQRLDVNVDRPLQHDRPLADGRVHQLVPREGPARLP